MPFIKYIQKDIYPVFNLNYGVQYVFIFLDSYLLAFFHVLRSFI